MSEGVRFCWHCDEPITKEWPGKEIAGHSPSAGGAQITVHVKCPRMPAYVRRTPR
ncbi:hypothetical protein [Streptomyces alfalfae]|uniref:hypothetical protein n=1 Tax=Streptomyces alfalfae TaxID=1642299 RepID=UPI0013C4D1B4|nr:hypothetical protein [Streptomyces alfalfae]